MDRARRYLVAAVLIVVGVAGVDRLGDAFQARPDRMPPDSRSEIVMEVRVQRYKEPIDDGAQHLVATCEGATAADLVEDPGIEKIGPGLYRFFVQPGLGPHTKLKMVGCLEDLTLDHLQADVISVERVA